MKFHIGKDEGDVSFEVEEHDHWNVNSDLAKIISVYLKNFRDKSIAYPGIFHETLMEMGDEDYISEHASVMWKVTINQMLDAFELLSDDNFVDDNLSKNYIIKNGLNLFATYYMQLWD